MVGSTKLGTYISVSRLSRTSITREIWIRLYTSEVLSTFDKLIQDILILDSLTMGWTLSDQHGEGFSELKMK